MEKTTNIALGDQSVLGSLGDFVVKIADCPEEIAAAQSLRHQVFFKDTQNPACSGEAARDEDFFDQFCDHLIVVESSGKPANVIATYRLMGQEQMMRAGRFYSQSEFDVNALTDRHKGLRFLELGRSCVKPEYRTKRTIELLWHGSWAYVRKHQYDVMFGCASFAGKQVEQHRDGLSFLFASAKPDPNWDVKALGDAIDLEGLCLDQNGVNLKAGLRSLPPLVKGYLRLGAMFATQAVIDHDFDTIDVLVLLPVSRLNPRYVNYYGENAERHGV